MMMIMMMKMMDDDDGDYDDDNDDEDHVTYIVHSLETSSPPWSPSSLQTCAGEGGSR